MAADATALTGEKGNLDFDYNGQMIHVIWLPDEYTPEREMHWVEMEPLGAGAMLVDFTYTVVEDWDLMGRYDEENNRILPSVNGETYPVKNKKALAKLPMPFLGALATAIGMSSRPKAVRSVTSEDG